jgi:hypothetical protein
MLLGDIEEKGGPLLVDFHNTSDGEGIKIDRGRVFHPNSVTSHGYIHELGQSLLFRPQYHPESFNSVPHFSADSIE